MRTRNSIFIDVDGTLLVNGQGNEKLIAWLKTIPADQFELVLWSARGKEHADMAARITGTAFLFDAIISKPGYIIDNDGTNWLRFVKSLNHVAFGSF